MDKLGSIAAGIIEDARKEARELKAKIAARNQVIAAMDQVIAAMDQVIAAKDQEIAAMEQLLAIMAQKSEILKSMLRDNGIDLPFVEKEVH